MEIEIILEPDVTPDKVAEIALTAENYGIRMLWHSNYHAHWDPFVTLVPAALATSKIKLGVLAVSPYELHPLKMANSLLSLNEISKGRAVIAIGGGGAVLSSIGYEFDYKKMRIVRGVREAIEILKLAASGQYNKRYEGEIFKVTRPFKMDWAKSEPPRIYGCATGDQMLRMAGRVADGIHMSDINLTQTDHVMEQIRTGLSRRDEAPEDFRITNFWAWHVKEDYEKSMYEARRELVFRAQMVYPFIGLEHWLDPEEVQFVKDNWKKFEQAYWSRSGVIEDVPAEMVERLIAGLSSAGTPATIGTELTRFKKFAEAGFTDLALRLFDDPMDGLRIIGERLVPEIKKWSN